MPPIESPTEEAKRHYIYAPNELWFRLKKHVKSKYDESVSRWFRRKATEELAQELRK